jgi:hypothetical protein
MSSYVSLQGKGYLPHRQLCSVCVLPYLFPRCHHNPSNEVVTIPMPLQHVIQQHQYMQLTLMHGNGV